MSILLQAPLPTSLLDIYIRLVFVSLVLSSFQSQSIGSSSLLRTCSWSNMLSFIIITVGYEAVGVIKLMNHGKYFMQLLVMTLTIVGVGALVWWAGRDMLQSTCLTCGNEFQVFKCALDDEIQQCPFCSQPFTVVDDKFICDSVRFTDESTSFTKAFRGFYPGSDQGGKEPSSSAVVDVEAEVKDAD